MPGFDLLNFLGAWKEILGIAAFVALVVFVALGARLDYIDWKRRPLHEPRKRHTGRTSSVRDR